MSSTVYADLQPRLRAVLIDLVIFLTVLILGGLFLGKIDLPGALKFAIVATTVLALEALLISFTGATIGQRIMGLRVLRADSHRNVGIVTAILRFIMKSLFGWYSLLVVMLTTRSQAIHDQICNTVVIDVRPETRAYDAVAGERVLEDPDYTYPPVWRRSVVIALYVLVEILLLKPAFYLLIGFISVDLLEALTNPELEGVVGVAEFAVVGGTVVFGWQGRLPGARRKKQRFAPMRRD